MQWWWNYNRWSRCNNLCYSSANDSFQLNKQLQVQGNISGSSFGGTTLLSSSNENFADYSQSVDSRLDAIEGPMSTLIQDGCNRRTDEYFLDSRLLKYHKCSDHETRIDNQELHSSSFTSNDLDMNGNKVLFAMLPNVEITKCINISWYVYHVHTEGKGYFTMVVIGFLY